MHNEFGIYYNSHNLIYKKPFGAVATETKVKFSIEVPNNADVFLCLYGKRRLIDKDKVAINIVEENGFRYETYSETVKLAPTDERTYDGRIVFTCEYVAPIEAITLEYFFKVEVNRCGSENNWKQTVYYANNCKKAGGIGECYDNYDEMVSNGYRYSMTVYDKNFTTPAWFKNSIMYQIFPDRFYNGNEDGSVVVKERERGEYKIYSSWEENMDLNYGIDDYERGERRIRNDFYGGNLLGILKKADYLEELGIDTIYLNPIFEAYSNHRYDTGDYMKIDPMLGSNEDFREVAKKLKKRGIRLVLDGVFNHTGSDSRYFNIYGKYNSVGAAQSKESPYADWYTFKDFDDNSNDYDCWWGISNVPNVNEMCESYFNYILGDDGVVQHWLKEGASGWRLDVADELPSEFLEHLRSQAKAINKDVLVIGEVWEDASRKYSYGEQREYLLGKQLDSVMNYQFYDVVIGFVGGHLQADEMSEVLMRIHENYPRECLYSLMNIIGTHDKPRAKTIFGGGAYRDSNAPGNGNATYAQKLANNRMKQAALFQMTYVGVPCIYYGDEIGMRGDGDPLNRGAFEWHDINEDVLDFYKAAIALRKEHPEFVSGEFRVIHAKKNIFAFERFLLDEGGEPTDKSCVVILNSSATDWCNFYLDIECAAVKHLFGMCYAEGKNISVSPTGGAVFEIIKNDKIIAKTVDIAGSM